MSSNHVDAQHTKQHHLFYADDAALLTRTAEEAAERMDAVCKALREVADMEIHLGKTKVMHAQETIHVEKPLAAPGLWHRGGAKAADREMRGMWCRLHDREIWCNNFYKTISDPGGCKSKPKSRTGTLAKKAVMRLRRKEAQKQFDHVCRPPERLGSRCE